MNPRVLVVDGEPDVRLALALYLGRAGFSVLQASSLREAKETSWRTGSTA